MPDDAPEYDVDHDEFISFSSDRNKEDSERSESAGESRQKIGKFLEKTGVDSKALSWCRSILKKKDAAKAKAIIYSLEKLLPMVKDHITGNQPDFLNTMEPAEEQPVEEPEGAA